MIHLPIVFLVLYSSLTGGIEMMMSSPRDFVFVTVTVTVKEAPTALLEQTTTTNMNNRKSSL